MNKTIIVAIAALTLLTACKNHSRRDEIEARRAALIHKQDSALAEAQQQLALVDSMLEAVKREHDAQHQWVMVHATELNDRSPEVLRLNALRAHRDSLQAQWQTLGTKIRYIRMKK